MAVSIPVRFDNPPVVEVTCGILFTTPKPLKASTPGFFWLELKNDFPRLEEMPPIPPRMERPANSMPQVQIQVQSLPPIRRTCLISEDGRHLIQLQQDRFLFSWKRAADDDSPYPSYQAVIAKFEDYLAQFISFLETEGLGKPVYRQFELSYINFIDAKHGLETVGEGGVLIDHTRDNSRTRFLPPPDEFNWHTSYPLPDASGRLHVHAQSAIKASGAQRIMRLDITARGIPIDASENGRRPWFEMAHDCITRGFADSTSEILHNLTWKRTS